jgi:hypothetical protein
MLVFWKKNLTLLSVPKTGTTALEAALKPYADIIISSPPELKHLPLYRYNRFMEKMFEAAVSRKPETVAVVREPISWLGSWYRYRQRDELVGNPNSTQGVSFDEFVQEYLKGKPEPFAIVGSQAKFLTGQNQHQQVDHLFRYEDLSQVVQFFEQRLGTTIDLPWLNTSTSKELILSKGVEHRLRKKRAQDFELYDRASIGAS